MVAAVPLHSDIPTSNLVAHTTAAASPAGTSEHRSRALDHAHTAAQPTGYSTTEASTCWAGLPGRSLS